MIQITSITGEVASFPDYIFSTQRIRFVEGDYVIIDNVQYLCSSIRKFKDSAGNEQSAIVQPVITDLPFDGNRPVKRTGLPLINPAAISVKTFLENYFYPFVPATIAFQGNDNTYEFGIQITVNLLVIIAPNDEQDIANRRIVELTNQSQVVFVGAENNFSLGIPIQGNEASMVENKKRSFRALSDVGGNGSPATIQSGLREFNFYHPTFYGMSNALQGSTVFSTFNKLIVSDQVKNFSLPLNGTNSTIWFLTPYFQTTPVIKDQNGFDVSDSFVKEAITLTTTNQFPKWTREYVVWRSVVPTTISNKVFTITFP
jgi:hypothetical protein